MYKTLKAELARRDIKYKEVAEFLGISEKTLRNKIQGVTKFTIEEGQAIRKQFLPELTFDELFLAA